LEKISVSSPSDFDLLSSAASEQRVKMLLEAMAPISLLETCEKRCSHTHFFGIFVKEIKTHASKCQRILARNKKIKIDDLTGKLSALKLDYGKNSVDILDLEHKLRIIADCDLREKAKDIKILECLQAEKATPLLVDLAKRPSSRDGLENIRDDDGLVFESAEMRGGYIRSFYEKLYKVDPLVEGEIEHFLGPEIASHPTVLASKLSMDEVTELDAPLDITELDKSLKLSNMRSAPGIDGFSYRFITEFWDYFRIPLFNCAVEGLENQSLPDFFMTAVIKLIPKKGDTSKISKWRPIRLLSNCSRSRRRAAKGDKRMVLVHTHGLFIT
jgi:hypothetical protein